MNRGRVGINMLPASGQGAFFLCFAVVIAERVVVCLS